MRRSALSGGLRALAVLAWLTSSSPVTAGFDCAAPQVLIEARFTELNNASSRALGVQWGLDGSFVVADGQQDGLIKVDRTGKATGLQPLNAAPFNLTPAAGRLYFHGLNASGRSLIGYVSDSGMVQQFLPNNWVSQGGLLTVGPDGSGVSFSNSLSSLLQFDRNLAVLSPPRVVTLPGKVAAMATWNGAPWMGFGSASSPSGLATVQPDGTIQVRSTLPNPPTVMEPCGDSLYIGGIGLLVRASVSSGGQIALDVTPTSLSIRGLSCLQGGDAMYVADGRVAGIWSASGTLQNYTVPGTGSFAGIAAAPGPNATALLLNSSGVPILGDLPVVRSFFGRNTSGCRETPELILFVTPRIVQ